MNKQMKIIITYDGSGYADAALHHSDRAYVLETGRIVMEGDSKVLADDPRVKEAYLGE